MTDAVDNEQANFWADIRGVENRGCFNCKFSNNMNTYCRDEYIAQHSLCAIAGSSSNPRPHPTFWVWDTKTFTKV